MERISSKPWLMRSMIVLAGIVTLLYATFIVYLGVYGYADQDPPHSYYVDGLEKPWKTTD